MTVTGLYAGLLALWLAFLFLYVVKGRFKFRVGLGDGGQDELSQRIRIHGNFIETVPFVLLIMLLLEDTAHSFYLLHAFGIALILSRILHFIGLRKTSDGSKPRMAAGIITVSLLIIGAVLLISTYIQSALI